MVIMVTVGLPGSGKSTWAKKWVSEDAANRVRVNRDDLRYMMHGVGFLDREMEDIVSRMEEAAVSAAVKRGKDVVVDAMHLTARYRKKWASFGTVEIVPFPTPIYDCVDRDRLRENPAGEDVIRRIAKRHRIPEGGELKNIDVMNVSEKPVLVGEGGGKPGAYLVDIDGTVALMGSRSPYATNPEDYLNDNPNWEVLRTVESLAAAGWEIVFLSGRSSEFRAVTEEWLSLFVWDPYQLIMRPEGDKRPDYIVKYELFDKHIRNQYDVIGVFDDRPSVLRMWRRIGLTTFQVGDGEEF